MNFVLHVKYPGHLAKEAIQAFTSPNMPKRPEYVKELASIGYHDAGGAHALFIFEIPNDKLADYMRIQGQRTVFFTSRVVGGVAESYVGLTISEIIRDIMPQLP